MLILMLIGFCAQFHLYPYLWLGPNPYHNIFLSVFAVERRRRDKINNWIVTLSKIIPDCNIDSTKTGAVSLICTSLLMSHICSLTPQPFISLPLMLYHLTVLSYHHCITSLFSHIITASPLISSLHHLSHHHCITSHYMLSNRGEMMCPPE